MNTQMDTLIRMVAERDANDTAVKVADHTARVVGLVLDTMLGPRMSVGESIAKDFSENKRDLSAAEQRFLASLIDKAVQR